MNTNVRTLCRAALALILILRLARFVAAEEPTRLPIDDAAIKKLLTTDFYGIYMQAKKIGWARDEMSLTGGADPVYVCRSQAVMNLLVAGSKMQRRFESTVEFDGRAPFAFRGGVSRTSDGKTETEIVVKRQTPGFTRDRPHGRQGPANENHRGPRLYAHRSPYQPDLAAVDRGRARAS